MSYGESMKIPAKKLIRHDIICVLGKGRKKHATKLKLIVFDYFSKRWPEKKKSFFISICSTSDLMVVFRIERLIMLTKSVLFFSSFAFDCC